MNWLNIFYAVEWAVRAAELGAGEILLTSMDRDGTKQGFDIELTRALTALAERYEAEERRGFAKTT